MDPSTLDGVIDDLRRKITAALDAAKQLPKDRASSLVITKLEEAQLWLGTIA